MTSPNITKRTTGNVAVPDPGGKIASFYIITGFILLHVSCKYEKTPIPPKNADTIQNTSTDSIPIFWTNICQNSDLSYLFDCNKENCYQIELFNDPFKDLVVITLNSNDSLSDIIRFNRFSFRHSISQTNNKKPKAKNVYPVLNPLTKDTLFCIHKKTKMIKMGKREDLNYFFSSTIWQIPKEDKSPGIDGESWRVKGRNGGKEISVVRWNFNDSLYYSNIQKLLDLFKIRDYGYKAKQPGLVAKY